MSNIFLNRYKSWGYDINPQDIELRQTLRINTLKVTEDKVIKSLKNKGVWLEKVPIIDNAYYFSSVDFALSSTKEYLLGYIYIQDLVSQIPPIVLEPKKNDTILDMAAAPGGKTTHLSALMNNNGTIIALDLKRDRLTSLNNNIERLGAGNVVVYNKDAQYADDLGIKFDKVLLDAPCSGNFCIDKDWLKKRSLDDIKDKSKLQKKLLKQAVKVLKNEGTIVYSTCSLEKEENEDVIEWALDNLPVKLEKIDLELGSEGLTDKTKKCKRFWPNETKTQGFFIAKLKKG